MRHCDTFRPVGVGYADFLSLLRWPQAVASKAASNSTAVVFSLFIFLIPFLFYCFSFALRHTLRDAVQYDSQYDNGYTAFKAKSDFHLGDSFQDDFSQAAGEIIAAITTMDRDIMIVWFIPVIMVGNASGSCTL